MGRRYRKSIKLGPLRINLSKSGVGYSVGNKFYRVTKKANGGMRTTATLPGTGISDVKDYSKDQVEEADQMARTKKKKKAPAIVSGAAALLVLIGVVAGGGDDSSKDKDSTPSTRQEQTVKPSTSTKTTTTTKTDTPAPSTSTETTTPSTPTEPKTETPAPAETKPETTTPAQASQPATQNERKVYRTKTGKRYHYDSHCNGGDYYEVTLSQAENAGLTPCKKCAGG